jgi:zinc and cadmium transporter
MLSVILLSSILVSLPSLAGAITLSMKEDVFKKIIFMLVSLSTGVLMGASLLHLIPEAIEQVEVRTVMLITLFGFSSFFLLERILRWRHCHENECDVHPVTYLALIGDSLHNFIDGVIIAGSYLIDFNLGLVTTTAVLLHEVPQELGDFAVLVHGGFTRNKAILFNFGTALTSVLGAILGYFLLVSENFVIYVLPFAAGNFLYIASSDLIPELHKETELIRSVTSFGIFLLGLGLMILFSS